MFYFVNLDSNGEKMKSFILLAFLVGAVFAAAIDDNNVSNSLFYLKTPKKHICT